MQRETRVGLKRLHHYYSLIPRKRFFNSVNSVFFRISKNSCIAEIRPDELATFAVSTQLTLCEKTKKNILGIEFFFLMKLFLKSWLIQIFNQNRFIMIKCLVRVLVALFIPIYFMCMLLATHESGHLCNQKAFGRTRSKLNLKCKLLVGFCRKHFAIIELFYDIQHIFIFWQLKFNSMDI